MLLRSGVDLVLELPFPFAASTAEFFARGGVEILTRLGVEELRFGSESGDLDGLMRAAEIAESPEFAERYAKTAQTAGGTAESYFALLGEMLGREAQFFSNDILGIAYLRALMRQGSPMRPVTVRRLGSGYTEETLSRERIPSATALRKAWLEKGAEAILLYFSKEDQGLLLREIEAGRAPASLERIERMILGHFRLTPAKVLEQAAYLGGGLGNRIGEAARRATGLGELLALSATKKYPDARIRRGILAALTGVTEEDLRAPVGYARLLGATKRGCAYLAEQRKKSDLPVVTRNKDLPATVEALRQWELDRRARGLYALTLPVCSGEDTALVRSPVIL
jgi:predicted nucleotidyltransferase